MSSEGDIRLDVDVPQNGREQRNPVCFGPNIKTGHRQSVSSTTILVSMTVSSDRSELINRTKR